MSRNQRGQRDRQDAAIIAFQLSEQKGQTAHPLLPFGFVGAIHNELLRNSHTSRLATTWFNREYLLTGAARGC
jgi:hypothetical protein